HTRFSRDWSSDVCSSDLVLRLEGDLHPGRDMVRHQRRDADPEVDVEAVLQFLRGAGGHLVAGPGHHAASLSRVVVNSIFLSYGRSEERRVGKERIDRVAE